MTSLEIADPTNHYDNLLLISCTLGAAAPPLGIHSLTLSSKCLLYPLQIATPVESKAFLPGVLGAVPSLMLAGVCSLCVCMA